ncbi:hypothetical protein Droror1_Dr00011686 [Drosera rotundifolia]
MPTEKLTEYERRRLENIKRNHEIITSLKIQSTLSLLSSATAAASKRNRVERKSYKVSPQKKQKSEEPLVMRRSLRCRGMPPDSVGLGDDFSEPTAKAVYSSARYPDDGSVAGVVGPVSMRDTSRGSGSSEGLIKLISTRSSGLYAKGSGNEELSGDAGNEGNKIVWSSSLDCCETKYDGNRMKGSVDLESFGLEPENIARVVPGRILSVRFFPTAEMMLVVAGNKYGDVGFWDVKSEDGDGIYLYHPHTEPVSGIVVSPFSLTKMYTSGYDGLLRLMDVEKEVFDLVYTGEDSIYSMSQPPNNTNSIYFGEGNGELKMWDVRVGKASATWELHDRRINSVDFSSGNTDIMATSSTDATACIWDLRMMRTDKPKPLTTVHHKQSVQSAYFSPSGTCLATTSLDNNVGLATDVNFEEKDMIFHNNLTGRWISTFKAIWGWDDSYIYIGNMKRGVDILSATEKRQIFTLESPEMSAIPCRFDAHPCKVGTLASATSGGQIYIWTQH